MEIEKEKLERFEREILKPGSHKRAADGMCVMEMTAFLAGEEHSDSPACASPVIASFLRSWNDALDDDKRQLLKPYAIRVIGTAATPEVEDRRSWLAADWLIRVYTPAWLDLAGLAEEAGQIRELAEITNATIASALVMLRVAEQKASAAWNAAWSAAWNAAWAAAESAARSTTWIATTRAGKRAAWSTAWSAAESAADSAARSTTRIAAESAGERAVWNATWIAAESAAEHATWSAAMHAAESTVWSTGWIAVWSAGWGAGWNTALSAAESTGWSAAMSAAEHAAKSASRSAVWSAAEHAAERAAWSVLSPTVDRLQQSAVELLDRMIGVE